MLRRTGAPLGTNLGSERFMLMPYFDEDSLDRLYEEPEIESFLADDSDQDSSASDLSDFEPLDSEDGSGQERSQLETLVRLLEQETPIDGCHSKDLIAEAGAQLNVDDLPQHSHLIIEFSKKWENEGKGKSGAWITARDAVQYGPKGLRSLKPDAIRFLFNAIRQKSGGSTRGEGVYLQFHYQPGLDGL